MSSSIFDFIPAASPPSGQRSNLIDPPNQTSAIIAISIVFGSLMTITVLIRFYVRQFLTHSLGKDDYVCLTAAVSAWFSNALAINSTNYGSGRHLWDIPASTLLVESNVRWLSADSITYVTTSYLVKTSILLLYIRVFHVDRQLRLLIQGTIGCFTIVYAMLLGLTIATVVQCANLVAVYSVPICFNQYTIILSGSIWNVVSDFWVLFLPMRSLLQLHLDRQHKLGLIAVFGTGAITCMISLARCILVGRVYNLDDALWTSAIAAQLSNVELNVAITMTCTPSLPRFYTKIRTFAGFKQDSRYEKSATYPSNRFQNHEHGSNVHNEACFVHRGTLKKEDVASHKNFMKTDSTEKLYSLG